MLRFRLFALLPSLAVPPGLLLSLLLGLSVSTASNAAEWLDVRIAKASVRLQVVRTEEDQRRGLMGKTNLPENSGMLFVFEPARPIAMWMKETLIDLDLAFLDDQARIVTLTTMKANTTDLHASQGPVSYAIEMPAGWFERHGVTLGHCIRALHQAKQPHP